MGLKSSIPTTYPPQAVSITKVYNCNLISEEPIGYQLKLASSKTRLYVYREELLKYLRKNKKIKNAELFIRVNPLGVGEIETVRSIEKDFSLNSGEHVVNINELQKQTWENRIDYSNPVQTKFTVVS